MNIVISGNRENYALMTTILSWTGMVVMSSLYLTIPLISLFSDYFNISLVQAGFTSSVFSLGFALGCFFYGAISEKYGRKNVIVFGLFSLSMITLLLGLVNDFSIILLLRGIQGLAAATFSPVALAYTLEVFPNDRKVGAIGFISTGFLVAGIVGQVFSGYVSEHSHWHVIFYVLAAVYLITALLVVWILPKGVLQNESKNIWAPLKRIGIIFTNRNLIFSYIISFVLLMSFVSMYIILGAYLTSDSFGMNSQNLIYIRAFGIVGMVMSPFAGKLAKRFNVLFVLKMALCLSIISLTVMSLISTIAGLTIISILFVGGIALAVPSLVTLVSQLGWNMGGIAVSMYTVILFAGTSIAPFISVYLIQTGSFTVAFLLLATTLSIGLVSALLIKSGKNVGSN
ncbi:MFS transporter [Lysinibacillus fusiformis]|uniref:Predicted arabinose efflux permease, MFS family n=1 Tax=Lysinibacillus fusiformis TaxID=28031 RepID=A0A1H9G965_9BACI|nr:MFS transporter [Lysinibacillus fusiformis]EAZ85953.1 putative permease; multidrug efflux protein [Bacillus sp. B14905]MED4075108.1 MFS transporter [Lysinibacillus fusiformis]PCD81842.1 MFS transporter [Lysinibacillus fusiformis]SCY17484.1 Predicted arabinose efflux permease, MFS family [Lysinibacillus fusiformis]SEN26768.1 Predicted arabinose efflux permease, MFS family [Lysinibacillus fusiformis]